MANIVCPNCRTENPPEKTVCQVCGASLVETPPMMGDRTVISQRVRETVILPPPAPKPVEEPPPPPSTPVNMVPPPPVPVPVLPPQPQAAPVPPPPPPAPVPVITGTPVNKLGVRYDSWSDLIEGEGEKAEEITRAFVDEIDGSSIEGLRTTTSTLVSGGAPRQYQLVQNQSGTTAAVRFAPVGKDLYVTWDLFTRRTINWLVIGIVGGVAFLLAVFGLITRLVTGAGLFGVIGFFEYFLGLILVGGLGLLLAGKLFKNDIWGFFLSDLDDFSLDDANLLGIVIDNAVTKAIEEGIE